MSEQLGQLKVIVVRGKRLVIRDFKTSDPYVVLKLGNQVTNIYIAYCWKCRSWPIWSTTTI